GDDRDGKRLQVARRGRRQPPAESDGERQRADEIRREGRPHDGDPDHRRTNTAMSGAIAPAVITAIVDAPASASAPATRAATIAITTSVRCRIASTTIPVNVAVIAKSTPKRRGSPIASPSTMPASVATFQST